MSQVHRICQPCRARILLQLYRTCKGPHRAWNLQGLKHQHSNASRVNVGSQQRRLLSSGANREKPLDREDESIARQAEPEDAETVEEDESQSQLQELEEEAPHHEDLIDRSSEAAVEEAIERARSDLDPAAVAQYARQKFGDRLPEGALRDEEYKHYERMYGAPLQWQPEEGLEEEDAESEDTLADGEGSGLWREGPDGRLEEVRILEEDAEPEGEGLEASGSTTSDAELGGIEPDLSKGDRQLRRDMAASLLSPQDRDLQSFPTAPEDPEDPYDPSDSQQRVHPFTRAARFGTYPSTIELPKDAMTGPVSVMTADSNNRHLAETAMRVFGGPGLPYSTGTPVSSRQMPQKPIPLLSSHNRMTPMEADTYMIALWPGMYASVTSVLVEVRKRLGSSWIESLLAKPGGPSVLDVGAGGAGIMAWREVLKAEWARIQDQAPEESRVPAPLGKATVLTGSSSLRHKASVALENTTFIPRLPDYVHVSDRSAEAQRKRFDIILAPHTLWPLNEDYLRRQHVDNLWSLLNPDGGILVLLEKGVPRGFEVVAGARQHILDHLFLPSSTPDVEAEEAQEEAYTSPSRPYPITKSQGAIIAPCTTHEKCPMYLTSGISKQRKDFCHFSQRYFRPTYMQRILNAASRNHEDVRFSYVAVQRGTNPSTLGTTAALTSRLLGNKATDRAFDGYDIYDDDLPLATPGGAAYESSVTARPVSGGLEFVDEPAVGRDQEDVAVTPEPATHPPNPFTLPRIILPPLKRHGHIILDVCTPAGAIERWTVPKSYGKVPYRDARKAKWGDLWALGAKTRASRRVRLGVGREGGRKGRQAGEEEEDADDDRGAGREEIMDVLEVMGDEVGGKVAQQMAGGARGKAKPLGRKQDKLKGRVKRRAEKRQRNRGVVVGGGGGGARGD